MFSHHLDKASLGCVCGSAWNYSEKGCSYLYPIVDATAWSIDEEGYSSDFYECRRGHAHCGRH